MKKRVTLLAKKEGMSASDFRHYWAGPHARLALGMDGIARYTQNPVEKVLWCSDGQPAFSVDGIVELYFASDEAMRLAQASSIGSRHIPGDEPNFLRGWSLCIVDTEAEAQVTHDLPAKVLVPFLRSSEGRSHRLAAALAHAAGRAPMRFGIDWTASVASREKLWSEPTPPMGVATLRFASVAAAHDALDEMGAVRAALQGELQGAAAYLVDELILR